MPRIYPLMRPTLYCIIFLLSIQGASSQGPAPNPFGIYRGTSGNTDANTTSKKSLPGARPTTVSNPGTSSAPRPVGTITDPGFAARLGNTVGSQGYPTVGLPPGVSNINHPGLQPLPSMQPLPTGLGFPLPSINYPGGTPSMHTPPGDPRKGRRIGFSGRGTSGVVYYGIPYYVPYYVYPTDLTVSSASAPASGYASPQSIVSPAGDTNVTEPSAKPLTLLAFKDHTVLIVVDYWLEGTWLYYEITPGQRLSGPLDRLDQPLTQQLNRERNVPFVLQTPP